MAAVEYEAIGKKFGQVSVMQDINFSIEEKKFVVLLGPSGCGKTTLLRMTSGLEKVTSGEIRFFGERVNEVHPRDRNIAMVFQTYALYPQMSVFDNIAFSLQVRKMSKADIKKSVEEAAEILDLTPYLKRYPKALSGGQRQRVAMGRALVRHPKVFLFDEPLSNLDAKLRGQMRYEIRRIHNQLDTTTVYVTHDQIEAMTMADEIVVMQAGNIEQIGSPDEIYDRPANTFVADFIGSPSINFLHGIFDTEQSQPSVRVGEIALPVSIANAGEGQAIASGTPVVYAVRPLDIRIDPSSPLKCVVEFVENTGAETHIHLSFGSNKLRVVSSERLHFAVGDQLGITPNVAKTHLFDQLTTLRIN